MTNKAEAPPFTKSTVKKLDRIADQIFSVSNKAVRQKMEAEKKARKRKHRG